MRLMPWFAHLFGIRPWEMSLLDVHDFEELAGLVDLWLDRGGQWQAPPQAARGAAEAGISFGA